MTPEDVAYLAAGIALTTFVLWGKSKFAQVTGVRGRKAFDAVEKETEPKKEK